MSNLEVFCGAGRYVALAVVRADHQAKIRKPRHIINGQGARTISQ